jgi:hypothetical protein
VSSSRVTRVTPQCGGMRGWLGHALVASLVALVITGASIARANASTTTTVPGTTTTAPSGTTTTIYTHTY